MAPLANWQSLARSAARRHGIDPGVFVRQIQQESGGDPRAVSPAGARGIAQIMPATARGWGVNPDDPRAALNAAARNMAGYVRQFGNYSDALRAYNAGPGNVRASRGFAETNAYVRSILGGKGGPGGRARAAGGGRPGGTRTTVTTTIPGIDNAVARAALIQSFLFNRGSSPLDFALQMRNLRDVAPISRTRTSFSPGGGIPAARGGGTRGGVASFGGHKVAGWIRPILDYARRRGWQGAVTSGYRSFAEQQRIYDSGVRPAAKPGTSNHEFTAFPGGAIDVSNAAELSRILKSSPYASKLVWAGAKDPVHFSHPRGGSY